ncbi:1-phosphofructokinase [Peptostreptococcus porci]|uniref:1-phosphofructokinase n=1 Tax=Peptostreptococcus porci TaxID=2652282 RepID=UPI002A90C3D4|nr:1-phosphofructokinase [Peptostreptococcus porci]MDY6231784.1 1-phosphofructokinase [Peptostreptococcus porci]
MIYSVTLNPSIDYIIHVDDFVEGSLNRSTKDYINVGGKGIMVSKLLTNVGVENTATGFLGGFTGKYISDWFDNLRMPHDFIFVEDNTRINVKLKSSSESEINGRGANIKKQEQQQFLDKINGIDENDTLIISGSSSPGLDEDIVDKIIDICKTNGADFVVDTSGSALIRAIKSKPLLIKPNIDEIGELFGKTFNNKEDVIPYGKKCLELGAKYVIVSMGSNGALFFDKDEVYYSPRVEGELVNSVGAGDSMLAGFVGSLKSGKSPIDSFKFSVACGTATAFCEDIADKKSVENILSKVVVEDC